MSKLAVFIAAQMVIVTILLAAILVTMQPPKVDTIGCYHHDGNGGWVYVTPCPS